jgi:flagellin-like hook-associated protein FlgL
LIEVFMGNGDGTFKASISSYAGVNPGALAFGDLNGDGRGDVIASDYGPNTLSVLFGNGNSTPFLPVLSLRTQGSSLSVLDQMTAALQRVTSELGSMGAAESRLAIATSNLQQIRINYGSAASQIEDVDVASEAAILTKNEILQRAGAAILARANQQPALALRLLRGI